MPTVKRSSFAPYDWRTLKQKFVIGVDEVGRGCLAGDVYAAAVILDPQKDLSGLTDSKMIRPAQRKQISDRICAEHRVGIGFATLDEIAKLNILHAALLAMQRACEKLGLSESEWNDAIILVDGNQKIPGLKHVEQVCLVKGDLRAQPISAASIVAKVARDEEITRLAALYPGYGFENHKGYATKEHQEAIIRLGPCAIHRRTFAGVREYLPNATTVTA